MAATRVRPVWLKLLSGTLFVALCMIALSIGTFFGYVRQSEVLTELVKQSALNTQPQDVFEGSTLNNDVLTVLLLGCDEDRAYGGKTILKHYARSDMMLVARLDFESKRITGISIPRDLQVSLPGYKTHKINAYHALGGKDLAREAAEKVLGVSIDKVIVLNFDAFKELVDMLGGVEVFIEKPLKYTDRRGGLFIDLKPGLQHLNGYQAMGFVRFRHTDSDFHRQARQKDFLFALKDAVFKDPTKIGAVADKALDITQGNLTAKEIAAIARFARTVGNDNIKMGMVPTFETKGYNLELDPIGLRKTLREYHFVDEPKLTASVRSR